MNEMEVMRVLRLPPLGKLVVGVGEQRYEALSDVTEDEIRHRLVAAIGELIVFAGGYTTLVDAGVAPPMTSQAAEAGPSIDEQQAAFLASLERQRDEAAQRAATPPRSRIPLLSPRPQPEPEAAQAATTEPKVSIAEQIDSILQKYVAADPKLANRSIHLEQAPAGGLHILVDGRYYQRPSEIEEREVQLVIKMALKEWEAS